MGSINESITELTHIEKDYELQAALLAKDEVIAVTNEDAFETSRVMGR